MVDIRGVGGYRLLLKKEQREVVSATNQLKLTVPDGKQLEEIEHLRTFSDEVKLK